MTHTSRATLTALLLTVIPVAAHAADGSFERKLSVHGPVLLSVETGSGTIRITPGDASEVHVVAHVHAGSADGQHPQHWQEPERTQCVYRL